MSLLGTAGRECDRRTKLARSLGATAASGHGVGSDLDIRYDSFLADDVFGT